MSFFMKVWRPNTTVENVFTLVGENMVRVRAHRINYITVPKFERIEVDVGDVMGWYYPNGPVGLVFDKCQDATHLVYAKIVTKISELYNGVIMNIPKVKDETCRRYSVQATIEQGNNHFINCHKMLQCHLALLLIGQNYIRTCFEYLHLCEQINAINIQVNLWAKL